VAELPRQLLQLGDPLRDHQPVGRVGILAKVGPIGLCGLGVLGKPLAAAADVVDQQRRRAQLHRGLELRDRGAVLAGVVGPLAGLESGASSGNVVSERAARCRAGDDRHEGQTDHGSSQRRLLTNASASTA
jgi:hypothetical protein